MKAGVSSGIKLESLAEVPDTFTCQQLFLTHPPSGSQVANTRGLCCCEHLESGAWRVTTWAGRRCWLLASQGWT